MCCLVDDTSKAPQVAPTSPKLVQQKGSVWFPDRDPDDAPAPWNFPDWTKASSAEEIEDYIPVVGKVIYEGSLAQGPPQYPSTARSSTDPAPTMKHDHNTESSGYVGSNKVLCSSELPERWPSGYYFGDGSGGPYSKYPTLRRCGVGLHYVNENKEPVFNCWQALPGGEQTVPRAELFALALAVEHIELCGVIDFFTDSLITANTYNKGPSRAKVAAHDDLWCQLFRSIKNKNLSVRVYWMPSHTDTQPDKKKKGTQLDAAVACAWE